MASKFTEVDLGDGIEAVNMGHEPGADEDEPSSSTVRSEFLPAESTDYTVADAHPEGISADSYRKHSQSSLQSSSSKTISQSTLSGAEEGRLKRDDRETSPPAYQDVEAQRRESGATTSTITTTTTEMTVGKQQTHQERAAGKGFFAWLTRTRPPPPYPSERTVSPEYSAGILSRLTFQWMSSMMSVSTGPSIVVFPLPGTQTPCSSLTLSRVLNQSLEGIRQLSPLKGGIHTYNSTNLRAWASTRPERSLLRELTTNHC